MRRVSKVVSELNVSVPEGNESPGVVLPCASAVPTTTGAPLLVSVAVMVMFEPTATLGSSTVAKLNATPETGRSK